MSMKEICLEPNRKQARATSEEAVADGDVSEVPMKRSGTFQPMGCF